MPTGAELDGRGGSGPGGGGRPGDVVRPCRICFIMSYEREADSTRYGTMERLKGVELSRGARSMIFSRGPRTLKNSSLHDESSPSGAANRLANKLAVEALSDDLEAFLRCEQTQRLV